MVMASALASGTERQTKLRERKFFPSSHGPSGQMTGPPGACAPHRVSLLRDYNVALRNLRCLSLEIYPMEMLADGQECSVPAAEAWCGLLGLRLCRRAESRRRPELPLQQFRIPMQGTAFFAAEQCAVPSHACPSSTRAVNLRCQSSYNFKKKELIFMPNLGDSSIFVLLMDYQGCLSVYFIHKLVWRQFFSSKYFFLK